VELESEEKKKDKCFYIILDNVVYGPLSKVRVSATLLNDDILNAPFMTFFPMDLPS